MSEKGKAPSENKEEQIPEAMSKEKRKSLRQSVISAEKRKTVNITEEVNSTSKDSKLSSTKKRQSEKPRESVENAQKLSIVKEDSHLEPIRFSNFRSVKTRKSDADTLTSSDKPGTNKDAQNREPRKLTRTSMLAKQESKNSVRKSEEEEEEEEEETNQVDQEISRATLLNDTWQTISNEIRSTVYEPSRVYKFRRYHSEPPLSLPFEKKFRRKSARKSVLTKVREKFPSCEDILLSIGNEYPSLVSGVLSEVKLRSYNIDENVRQAWKSACDLEQTRFSFLEELVAIKCVTDSLEVPSHPPKDYEGNPVTHGDYFIEADEKHYKKKVDFGRVVFKTKNIYTGNFKNWYFEGPGRYSWLEGTVYQGEFSQGLMHGMGRIYWPNGAIYEGHFVNGMRIGWGVCLTEQGYTYAGEWSEGVPNGKGKMWYDPEDENSDYFDGKWKDGLPSGFGTRQYSTGDRYVGNWDQGKRNGYGIMIWLQERQVYKGEWLDGLPNGFGKQIWYFERTVNHSFPTRHVYQGDWVSGKREGIGKMVYPCGSIYEGHWKNGQRDGKGIFINPAGDLLTGLFRAGSLLGGSEVPLHSPTYECDHGGLIQWLIVKFNLNFANNAYVDDNLQEITKQYLPYLRRLYLRAGTYSQEYGNHGLYPGYKKKPNVKQQETVNNSAYPTCATDHQLLNENGRGNGDEPEHMKGKVEKPESLDGVNPVTRFGLWLLIRDCDGLLDEDTMAYYDKMWCESPSISFQTRHNPFEPVYLWQFLQCLIIVAVAYYQDIPRKHKHDNTKSSPAWHDEMWPDDDYESDMHSDEKHLLFTELQTSQTSLLSSNTPYSENTDSFENKVPALSRSSDDKGARNSKSLSDINQNPKTDPFTEDELEEEEEEADDGVFDTLDQSISQCFETLIVEKLLPCLKRKAGINLPQVPQPLPALVDMYEAFKGNKNRDIIKAPELLQSVLPHLLFPSPNDVLWWHRCSEPLSNNVNFDELVEISREKFTPVLETPSEDDWKETMQSVYLGTQAQQRENSLGAINLQNTEANSSDSYSDISTDKRASFITEGCAFSKDEFVREPFLWADDYKCVPIKKNLHNFENITTQDVFNVFQELNPRLCVPANGSDKNMGFNLIFCDWLWCTSLLAKLSVERDFRNNKLWDKKTLQVSRPITNPQSYGVYSHYMKNIKNNAILFPRPSLAKSLTKQDSTIKTEDIIN